jgi:hypothetical protein
MGRDEVKLLLPGAAFEYETLGLEACPRCQGRISGKRKNEKQKQNGLGIEL